MDHRSITLNFMGLPNWYRADQQTMVIGPAKQNQIAAHSVLATCLDVLRSVLTGGARRLLCIGYSFCLIDL